MNKPVKGKLYWCEKCKRPLLERLPNGLWRFKFGRKNRPNGDTPKTEFLDWAVDMYIYGSVKIRCFRSDCLHWNTFNFFPPIIKNTSKGEEVKLCQEQDR